MTLARRNRERMPSLILLVATLCWILLMRWIVLLRHASFNTFDFDLGIHDQSLWLLAHGHWFNTVCGLPVFGHHASFMYVLLAPLTWIGAGPDTWNVLQVFMLGSAAGPVFLLARDRTRSEWIGLLFGIAWLLAPTTAYLAFETFHPETMAVPFLLMAYRHCTSGQHSASIPAIRANAVAFAWVLAAMLWKEDVALAIIGISIVVICRGRRRFGVFLLAFSAVYFVVVALWLVPKLAGDNTAYGMLYGDLGRTPTDVLRTSVAHPSMVIDRLRDNNALGYLGQIAAPFGFLTALAPIVLVMGMPQYFINILTTSDFTWSMMYHYQAVPLATAATAAVEGLALLKRHSRVLTRLGVLALCVAGPLTTYSWGMLPIARDEVTFEDLSARDVSGYTRAIATIGPDDAVSAEFDVVPHLTHRQTIYTFPNPWIRMNFLSNASMTREQCKIQWIVLDKSTLDPESGALLESLVSSGTFELIETVAGVSTYRRIGEPCT